MADEHNTDVSGNVTPQGEPTLQQAAHASGDSGVQTGLERRIDGLTAEKGRAVNALSDLQKRYDELAEKHKTDGERATEQAKREAVEEFKRKEYEPVTTMAKAQEARLVDQISKMREETRATLPADFDERDTIYKYDFLSGLKAAAGIQPAVSVGNSVNPPSQGSPRVVPMSEFRTWQNTNMHNPQERSDYEAKKDEMNAAYREGRIDWKK